MKTIDFIFIGTSKNKSYGDLEVEYHKRIRRYAKSELIYLKDSPDKNPKQKKKKESDLILQKIKSQDLVVICDETGKGLDTIKFSKQLSGWQQAAQRVVFVIGGAYGMTPELIKRARFVLKLSDFTLPHELARVALLEQVYRCFTVLKREGYHH